MSGNMSINGNQGPDWSNMSDGPNMSGGHGDNDRQIAAMEQEIHALMASQGSASPQMGNADCMPGNGAFGNAGSGSPSQSWGAQPWAGGQGSNAGGSFPSQSWGAQPWAGEQGSNAGSGFPSQSWGAPSWNSQPWAGGQGAPAPASALQPAAQSLMDELTPDATSQPPASTSGSSQPPASTSTTSFPNGNETEYQSDQTQAGALETKARQALADGAATTPGLLSGDNASAADDFAAAAKLHEQAAQVATNDSDKSSAEYEGGNDNAAGAQVIWQAGDAGPGKGGQAQYNQDMDAAKADLQNIANDSNVGQAIQNGAAKAVSDLTTMEAQTQLGNSGNSQAWQDAMADLQKAGFGQD